MKNLFTGVLFTLFSFVLFSQKSVYNAECFQTPYEKEILQKTDATPLELWMAAGAQASKERTAAAKAKLDACIEEFKSSKSMQASEAKQIKALRSMIQERFLLKYKMMTAFPDLFEGGGYNCVTATALFAMVMEQLGIPYSIQELPSSVNLIAYPDTKAIAIEMTNSDNLPNMPERKPTNGLGVLVELHVISTDDILREGPVFFTIAITGIRKQLPCLNWPAFSITTMQSLHSMQGSTKNHTMRFVNPECCIRKTRSTT